jgi:hypothetical protein
LKSDFQNKKPILCAHQGRIQDNIFSFDFKNFGYRVAQEIQIDVILFKIINNKQVQICKFQPSLFLSELIPLQESIISFSSGALILESDFFIKLHFSYVDTGDSSKNTNEYFFKIHLTPKHGFNIFNLNESEFKQVNETKVLV